ncbi:MAG: mitofilin family membrane protein [Pseudomonadota bacterium]
MAKKTTTRKGTSRGKKPAQEVEDAEIVDGAAEDSGDTVEAVVAEDVAADAPEPASSDDAPSEVEASTTDAKPVVVAHSEESKSGGGAIALIFGGVVAGAIGFFAAVVGIGVDEPPLPEPVDLSGIEQSIVDQGGRLDELAGLIKEPSAPADLSGVAAEIAALTASIAALEDRVTAVEAREPVASGAVDPALRDGLEDLKSTIAALEAENEAAKADARSAAEATLRRAAMTQVETALDSGAGFGDVLVDLTGMGVEVPAALTDAAEGVPTLASLQDSFPDAARAALADDRAAAAESGDTGGLTGFFKSQLGARSLTPQEGDGTDAVLSRAEAALRDGRLTDALSEIETLPEVAQPAMADWVARAAGRAGALQAANTLSDSLN